MRAVDVRDNSKSKKITIVNAEGVIQGPPIVVASQTALTCWLDDLGYNTVVDVENPEMEHAAYRLLKKDGKYALGERKQDFLSKEQPPATTTVKFSNSKVSNKSW